MVHYFTGLAVATALVLLTTLITGALTPGTTMHLSVGLFGAMIAVATHSLCIVFMIVTGRVLKEAMASRPLGAEFLAELNEFFTRKKAYPVAVFAAFGIVAVAVLGYANRGFGLHPAVHMSLGVLAIFFNFWALQIEYGALRDNQRLIDRAASVLDALDKRAAEEGQEPAPAEEPLDPRRIRNGALIFSFSVWLPYFYWVFIEWRGDFSMVSIHPWVELCAAGLFVAFLGWRATPPGESPADPTGA